MFGTTPALRWGLGNQNLMVFAAPIDNLLTYQLPRDGSEFDQSPSGVEDAWLIGPDYYIEGDVRWIPEGSAVGGIDGWTAGMEDLLWWAKGKNTVRFIPDITAPGNFVDCYLVSPGLTDPPILETTDYSYNFHLKLRNGSRHLGLAQRGLVLDYIPGQGVPATWTVQRASAGWYFGSDGLLHQAANNVARENSPPDWPGNVSLLIEGAATNLVENNGYETDVVGLNANHGAIAQDNSPLGANPLEGTKCARVDLTNIANAGHYCLTRAGTKLPVVVGGFYVNSHWVFVPPNSPLVGLLVDVGIEWYDGTGTFLSQNASQQALKAGWNFYWSCFAAVASSVTAIGHFFLVNAPGGVYSWWTELNQFERQDFNQAPTSPILSSTVGGVTRASETIYMPFAYPPQPMWVYRRWIERSKGTNGAFPNVMYIGDVLGIAGLRRFWRMYRGATGNYGSGSKNRNNTQDATSAQSGSAAIASVVEAVYEMYADGSIALREAETPLGGARGADFYSGRTAGLLGGTDVMWGDPAHQTIVLALGGDPAAGAGSHADELLELKVGIGTPPPSIAAAAIR